MHILFSSIQVIMSTSLVRILYWSVL